HGRLGGDGAQGVAVRRGLGDGEVAHDPAAARPVHYVDGGAQRVAQHGGEGTRDGVGAAAGVPGDDVGDGAAGVGGITASAATREEKEPAGDEEDETEPVADKGVH